MKAFKLLLICGLLTIGNFVKSQNRTIPDVDIYTLEGKRISASDISKNNEPVVIFFWKTTDLKSLDQLFIINDGYENQLKWKNVKIVGICTDCPGTAQSIKPFVYGNDISFDIYIDQNNDLKRAMNVHETPYTILIDKEKNTCSMIMGYCANIVELINDKFDKRFAKVTDKK